MIGLQDEEVVAPLNFPKFNVVPHSRGSGDVCLAVAQGDPVIIRAVNDQLGSTYRCLSQGRRFLEDFLVKTSLFEEDRRRSLSQSFSSASGEIRYGGQRNDSSQSRCLGRKQRKVSPGGMSNDHNG